MRKAYRSFLVINTFGIGDVLFSTPLVKNLRTEFPGARIYYLCNKKTAPMLLNHPLIDKVFVYERDEFVEESKGSWWRGLKKYLRFIRDIRQEHIEASIDLSLNTPFGFFAWAAGIRNRFGLDYKNRGIFLTKKLKIEGFIAKHVVEYYLDTLKLLEVDPQSYPMEVYTDQESGLWADEFLRKSRVTSDEALVGVVPCGGASWGADAGNKQWPQEKFASLIRILKHEPKTRIVLFGSKDEAQICGAIADEAGGGILNTAGQLSLSQLTALLKRCKVAVCNNAGPLHIAVALGVKTVCINGPVSEKVYGAFPASQDHMVIKKDLPCRPCYNRFRLTACRRHKRCLSDITELEVLEAVNSLLRR